MPKSLISSKMFWINFITILIGIAGLIQNTFPVNPQIVLLIVGVLNIILRTVTEQPISGIF